MFKSVDSHCAGLSVNHTFDRSNESYKAFNTLRRKSMIKKIASVLNNYEKKVDVSPLVSSLLESGMSADYTTTSKGIVTHIKINLGDDHTHP